MLRSKKKVGSSVVGFEGLESRIAMAANVTASLDATGLLTIEGTSRRDNIAVNQSTAGIVVSNNGTSVAAPFRADAVRSIKVSLLEGNDVLGVFLNQKRLDSVAVDVGTGTGDQVNLACGQVGAVTVNAIAGTATGVKFTGLATGRVLVDYGTEPSNNVFRLAASSAIGTLQVRMGEGDDLVALDARSRVVNAQVSMGGGDDILAVQTAVVVDGGTIDGGSGYNRITGQRGWLTGGVRLVNFH